MRRRESIEHRDSGVGPNLKVSSGLFRIIMQEIKTFIHKAFGQIRTMTNEKGETFFVGKDIASALGYSKPENAVAVHVDSDDKTTTLIQGTGSNYKTKVVIINESGLYSLILSSKLQHAKRFKHWVTSEVLPEIRRTGRYELGAKELQVLGEKAEYCDEVLESVSCFTTTQIAKELSMTVHDLTRFLVERRVLYKQSGQWLLYADYARKGYAKSRTHTRYDAEGDLHTTTYLVWTERGRRMIHRICKTEELMIPFLLSDIEIINRV